MSFRPVLRPGLRLLPQVDGGVSVEDPPSGVALVVGPDAAGLLALLDGHLDAAQALAVSGVDPAAGDRALRSLALCGCLLGVDEDARRRRVEARASGTTDAEVAPFRFASDTRFECGRCGACCRTVDFGPLTREEMDRLARAQFVQADPALRQAPLFVREDDPDDPLGRSTWRLARREDGACVFLDEAGRCRVHVEMGRAARPLGCQAFPFVVRRTSDGVVVADGLECATFSTSAAAGEPVYARFDALRPVLRAAARRAAPPERDGVRMACGVTVPAAHARLAVGRAIEVMDATPGGWLAGASAALGALAAHDALLLAEPLGPGLPERVVQRLWATPLEVLAEGPDGAPAHVDVAGAWRRVLDRVARAVLPAWAEALDDDAPLDPGVDAALRRALRQRLHGLPLEAEGALAPAVVGALAATALTRARARGLARAQGRAPTLGDLDLAQPAVTRALRQDAARAALREREDDLTTILSGGASLARRGQRVAMTNGGGP